MPPRASQHMWAVEREFHVRGRESRQALGAEDEEKTGTRRRTLSGIKQALAALLRGASQAAVLKELSYFKEHQKRTDYTEAARRSEPRGTSAIESTCGKYQCHIKRPGQFWIKTGDDALLCFWAQRPLSPSHSARPKHRSLKNSKYATVYGIHVNTCVRE